MRPLNRLFMAFLVVLISMTLVPSSVVLAESKDGSCPGNSCINKLTKGSNDIKGNLKTEQHIYYVGETLVVSIKFSRGWELLADGEVDAYVVAISPDAVVYPFLVDNNIGPTDRTFFNIQLTNVDTLLLGQYQVALIATLPEGDPTNIGDWHNGFRGLLDMEGVYITDEPLAEDANLDGECDFDDDDDGFCDDLNLEDDDDDDDDDDPDDE